MGELPRCKEKLQLKSKQSPQRRGCARERWGAKRCSRKTGLQDRVQDSQRWREMGEGRTGPSEQGCSQDTCVGDTVRSPKTGIALEPRRKVGLDPVLDTAPQPVKLAGGEPGGVRSEPHLGTASFLSRLQPLRPEGVGQAETSGLEWGGQNEFLARVQPGRSWPGCSPKA